MADKTTGGTGQQLVERWIAFIRTYVSMTEAQGLVVALWAINTWLYDRFSAVPFLEIVATTKRSGKTTLLDVLKMLTRGAEKFAIVRILTVLRMIEAYEGRVTILIDEAEQFSKPSLGEQRSGIATGYKAGSQHAISTGKTFTRFRTFAPWAFAQIGNVHDVLRDRCIEIELERAKPERVLSEWTETAQAEAQALIAELVDYSKQSAHKTGGTLRVPIVPAEWLSGRERELWTPIVSVAHWLNLHADTLKQLQIASVDMGLLKTLPAKVWHSAQDETDAEDRDMATRVVQDIRSVVAPGETFIPSSVLVDRLRGIAIAPWRMWRGNGLNETTLAALLDRYGVGPVQKRIKPKPASAVRGYDVKAINGIKL